MTPDEHRNDLDKFEAESMRAVKLVLLLMVLLWLLGFGAFVVISCASRVEPVAAPAQESNVISLCPGIRPS